MFFSASPDDAAANVDRLCKVVERLVETNTDISQRLHILESRLAMLGQNVTEGPDSTAIAQGPMSYGHALMGINASTPSSAASIRTITSYMSIASNRSATIYHLTFEKVLFKTRVYKNALRNGSRSTISLPGHRGSSWSILSGISLAEISNISILSLPLSASELFNPQWYDETTSHATPASFIPTDQDQQPLARRRRPRSNSAFASAAMVPSIVAGSINPTEPRPSPDPRPPTILHYAVKAGDIENVLSCLANGENPEEVSETGYTLLQLAATHGHASIVQVLIEKQVNIEGTGRHWYTPLQLAAESGHDRVVQILLEKGAHLDAQGGSQNTALHLAAAHGRVSAVRVLLDSGANIEIMNRAPYTPLHLASRGGHNGVIEMLFDKGALVGAEGASGNTALHLATMYAQQSTVRLLLDKGADTTVLNRHGYTPLRLAAKYWDENGHRLLLNVGVPVVLEYDVGQAEPTLRLLLDRSDRGVITNELGYLINLAVHHKEEAMVDLLRHMASPNE